MGIQLWGLGGDGSHACGGKTWEQEALRCLLLFSFWTWLVPLPDCLRVRN